MNPLGLGGKGLSIENDFCYSHCFHLIQPTKLQQNNELVIARCAATASYHHTLETAGSPWLRNPSVQRHNPSPPEHPRSYLYTVCMFLVYFFLFFFFCLCFPIITWRQKAMAVAIGWWWRETSGPNTQELGRVNGRPKLTSHVDPGWSPFKQCALPATSGAWSLEPPFPQLPKNFPHLHHSNLRGLWSNVPAESSHTTDVKGMCVRPWICLMSAWTHLEESPSWQSSRKKCSHFLETWEGSGYRKNSKGEEEETVDPRPDCAPHPQEQGSWWAGGLSRRYPGPQE